MSDDRTSNEVRVEGTQFYKRSMFADVLRIVIITVVTLVAVAILAAWAIADAGARKAYKEARDIRRALRIVGTEYYGERTSIYDPHSANGMISGAAEKIEDMSTRSGEVILYSWDDENTVPLQFEYRTGLYRVIYTDAGVEDADLSGIEGSFRVYYSLEILHFDAE